MVDSFTISITDILSMSNKNIITSTMPNISLALLKFPVIICFSYVGEATSPDKGISDNYHSVRWTPLNVHLLKAFYQRAPLSVQCNQSDGSRFPVSLSEQLVTRQTG